MSKPPSMRWNAYWPKSTLDLLDAMAAERGMARKEVVVLAVNLMQVLNPVQAPQKRRSKRAVTVSGLTGERESR